MQYLNGGTLLQLLKNVDFLSYIRIKLDKKNKNGEY